MKKLLCLNFLFFLILTLNADNLIDDYYKAISDANTSKSIIKLKQIIKLYPTNLLAIKSQLQLGYIFFLQEKYDLALNAFEKVIQNYPYTDLIDEAYFNAAINAFQTGHIKKSMEYYDLIINKYKKSEYYIKSIINLADIYYYNDNIKNAIDYYNLVLLNYNDYENKSWIYFQLGNCYFSVYQYEQALVSYLTLINFYPGCIEYENAFKQIELIQTKYKKNIDYKVFKLLNKIKKTYFYRIQIAAFKSKNKAKKMYDEIKNKYKPKKSFITLENNNWYKLKLGDFDTKEEAQIYMKNNKIKGFITKNRK